MYVCVWCGVWGVDGGGMPLPTRPQRYCDPASLVMDKMLRLMNKESVTLKEESESENDGQKEKWFSHNKD